MLAFNGRSIDHCRGTRNFTLDTARGNRFERLLRRLIVLTLTDTMRHDSERICLSVARDPLRIRVVSSDRDDRILLDCLPDAATRITVNVLVYILHHLFRYSRFSARSALHFLYVLVGFFSKPNSKLRIFRNHSLELIRIVRRTSFSEKSDLKQGRSPVTVPTPTINLL